MGAWGIEPTANDSAADWLEHLFDALPLARYVEESLHGDPQLDIDEIRIAAYLVCTLSEAGLWPHEQTQRQVPLAVSKLESALMQRVFRNPHLIAAVRNEVRRLQSVLN